MTAVEDAARLRQDVLDRAAVRRQKLIERWIGVGTVLLLLAGAAVVLAQRSDAATVAVEKGVKVSVGSRQLAFTIHARTDRTLQGWHRAEIYVGYPGGDVFKYSGAAASRGRTVAVQGYLDAGRLNGRYGYVPVDVVDVVDGIPQAGQYVSSPGVVVEFQQATVHGWIKVATRKTNRDGLAGADVSAFKGDNVYRVVRADTASVWGSASSGMHAERP